MASVASVLLLAGCGGGEDPADEPETGATTSTAPGDGAPQQPPGDTSAAEEPAETLTQPAVPADPSGYTPEYVEQTLQALMQDYRAAFVALKAAGSVDETVRSIMADVYHPQTYDIQVRNLEDYYGDGADIADEPGEVLVTVDSVHSASAQCILAITRYDIQALTKLEAPAEDGYFIGLARNPDAADTTRPWLVTVEYTTSDGQPLPEDVCA